MTQRHLSDAELLGRLDHGSQHSGAQEHLNLCEACRARLDELRQASTTLGPLLRSGVPPADAARARLRVNLAAAATTPRGQWTTLTTAAAMLLAVCGLALLHHRHQTAPTVMAGQLVPDIRVTPGATRPVTLSEICKVNEYGDLDDGDLDPTVSPAVRQTVFQEYGLTNSPTTSYQVDYLINPQLGGTDDIRNLWPEPYRADWNALAKDALEDRLHQMVCNRQLDLATAQQEIATDWIEAYKKYFHTTHPLS